MPRRRSVRRLRRPPSAGTWWSAGLRNPARLVAIGFLVSIAIGTGLLMLPAASHGEGGTDLFTALFTATSAVCVIGLTTVDTAGHWSVFGELVLVALMQVGGVGVMTFASLLALLVIGRLGLGSRLLTHTETTADPGTAGRLLFGILRISLAIELTVWLVLTLRLWLAHGQSPGKAAYFGLFHAVSAFNNAGFSLWSDSLMSVAGDPWIVLPISFAFILGGIGYPVLLELSRRLPLRTLSLHTKLTLVTSFALIVVGAVIVTVTEWSNPATLGGLATSEKLLSGWLSGVTPRSAGFNTIDYAQVEPATLFSTVGLMFIGGGSASTAGGIKVTTLAVVIVAILAEIRGDSDVDAFDRRISDATVRQAMAIGMLAIGVVTTATFALLELSDLTLNDALFEVTSAATTSGLSTGVTKEIPLPGQVLLVVLMVIGRIGPVTAASALALRSTRRAYRNPEARPLVG